LKFSSSTHTEETAIPLTRATHRAEETTISLTRATHWLCTASERWELNMELNSCKAQNS